MSMNISFANLFNKVLIGYICIFIFPFELLANITDKEFLGLLSKAEAEINLKKRFILYHGALSQGSERQRFMIQHRVVELAYRIGEIKNATVLARELIDASKNYEENPMHDTVIHHAHTILGRIAISNNNIEIAKEHLLASADVSFSPTLQSFGPSMSLAYELFKQGEKDIVVRYLILSKQFWDLGANKLDEWISTINDNGEPNFGENINY